MLHTYGIHDNQTSYNGHVCNYPYSDVLLKGIQYHVSHGKGQHTGLIRDFERLALNEWSGPAGLDQSEPFTITSNRLQSLAYYNFV